jgi:hypothetical protein
VTSEREWELDKMRFTAETEDEDELGQLDTAMRAGWEVFATFGEPQGERVFYIRRRDRDLPTHFS